MYQTAPRDTMRGLRRVKSGMRVQIPKEEAGPRQPVSAVSLSTLRHTKRILTAIRRSLLQPQPTVVHSWWMRPAAHHSRPRSRTITV